jgi:hypothetical protein
MKEYQLEPGEREAMHSLNLAALNAKARIFDLQVQLEQARGDLAQAQHRFNGALMAIAARNGMTSVQIAAADFSKVTGV